MSAASAAALIQCSSNFRYGGQDAFSVASEDPCLFFMAQFQIYAVFSYLLYENAMLRS